MENTEKLVKTNKLALTAEIFYTVIILVFFLGAILFAEYFVENNIIKASIIVVSIVLFLIAVFFSVYMESKIGNYECKNCNNKYEAKFFNTLMAPHCGFTRYMKCPECGKSNWQKKVLD